MLAAAKKKKKNVCVKWWFNGEEKCEIYRLMFLRGGSKFCRCEWVDISLLLPAVKDRYNILEDVCKWASA